MAANTTEDVRPYHAMQAVSIVADDLRAWPSAELLDEIESSLAGVWEFFLAPLLDGLKTLPEDGVTYEELGRVLFFVQNTRRMLGYIAKDLDEIADLEYDVRDA